MTLLAPAWLAAYPLLLLLWWLRPRGGARRPVAALFLWEGAAAGGRGRRLRLRPGGLRTPLLLALLCLALAAPRWGVRPPEPTPPAATGVACEGPLPAPLRAYLAGLNIPCTHASPWSLEVAPGEGEGEVRWALQDPLLAGAPPDPITGHHLRPLEAGEWDRVLAYTEDGPVVLLHPTPEGARLVIGADLATSGLRDAPALPLLLAAWSEAIRDAPPSPHPMDGRPLWPWPVAAALGLLWLPWPRHRGWAVAATLPLVASLLLPGGTTRVLLLDRSPSCATADLATAAAEMARGARRLAVVAVAAGAEVWVPRPRRPRRALAQVDRLLATPPPAAPATDLEAALARAASLGREVVVVSDGRAAPFTPPAGVRVHCRLLPSACLTLHLPGHLSEGGAVTALARLTGIRGEGSLTWRVDGRVVAGSAARGGAGRLGLTLTRGAHRIEVATPGLPPAAARLAVGGRGPVAVVGDEGLASLLGVERVAPAALRRRLATTPPAALVVPGDAELDAATWAVVARRVEDGMGLLATAGDHGLAAEKAPWLPLQPGREGGRRPLAVVVVLDRSGSMSGEGSPLDLGIAATMAVRRGLAPEDRWALLCFDRDLHLLDPLGPPPPLSTLRHRLARLTGAGGTDPWRAIGEATRLAAGVGARGEVVLITDGVVPPPPAEMASRLRGVRLTLIEVGGRPAPPALSRLCRATGGQVVRAATSADLPASLTFATPPPRRATAPAPVTAAGATPFPLPEGGAAARPWPAHAAAGTRVVLRAGGDPLLALDHHGLGRVAHWSAPAADLAAVPELLSPLVAWLAPTPGGLRTTLAGVHLWVGLTGTRRGAEAPRCTLRHADGATRPLPLRPVKGGWSCEALLDRGGVWAVEVEHGPGETSRTVVEMGDPEWAITPAAGRRLLARLARTTGGRLLRPGETPPPPPPRPAPPALPLATAMALLLVAPRPRA